MTENNESPVPTNCRTLRVFYSFISGFIGATGVVRVVRRDWGYKHRVVERTVGGV